MLNKTVEAPQQEHTTESSNPDFTIDDLLIEIQILYPEQDINNEEDALTFLLDEVESLSAKVENFESENAKIYSLASENPEIALIFSEVLADCDKSRPIATILTNAGIDLTPPSEGDTGYEEYNKIMKARHIRRLEAEQRKKELEANYLESVVVIERFLNKLNLSEKEERAFTDFYEEIIDNSNKNLYTEKSLAKMYQAFKYEEDVENARRAGEIEGKNAKIEIRRRTKAQQTDGLPSSGGSVSIEKPKKHGYIEGLLRNY
ncbi:MAG: hypothetical protein R3Y26_05260 [Rikenellaceae bacterium]